MMNSRWDKSGAVEVRRNGLHQKHYWSLLEPVDWLSEV